MQAVYRDFEIYTKLNITPSKPNPIVTKPTAAAASSNKPHAIEQARLLVL